MPLFGPFVDKQGPVLSAAFMNLLDALQQAIVADRNTKGVTIGPTLGAVPLQIQGIANQNTVYILASPTVGQSFGLIIDAGTNAADRGLLVRSAVGGNVYFEVFGDGHIVMGPPVLGKILQINVLDGTAATDFNAASAPTGFYSTWSHGGIVKGAVGTGSAHFTGASPSDFGMSSNGGVLRFSTNFGATTNLQISATGAVVINAPTSGNAIFASGAANNNVAALNGSSTSGQSFGLYINAGTTSADYAIRAQSQSGTDYFKVRGDGSVQFNTVGTTASAANAFLDNANSNNLLRSTSSIRYKKDVEDLEVARADAILGLRPVWYRSLAEADRKDWSWYGLIAEEVAKIEPRLVHWTRDIITPAELDEDGVEIVPAIMSDLRPDAVQYERVSVHLLSLVQRMHASMQKAGMI